MLITYYPSLFQVKPVSAVHHNWDGLTTVFVHVVHTKKEAAPGFGAHCLRPITCVKHKDRDGKPTVYVEAHRCNDSVAAVTLFVFDVDVGTQEDVDRMKGLLRDSNQAAFLYSSYSYRPDHPTPPFRLLIPPTREVAPHEFDYLRSHLIEKYKIPCAPEKCSSPAHFWFLPSCPPDQLQNAVTERIEGSFFDVDRVIPTSLLISKPVPLKFGGSFKFELPEEPEEEPGMPVDLSRHREKLAKYVTKLRRQQENQKALYLQRLLDGEALEEHGGRNQAALQVTGILAWVLPDTPLSHLMLLFRPSLNAMVAAGSKLTEGTVEGMFVRGMYGRAQREAEREEFKQAWRDAFSRAKKTTYGGSK